MGEGENMTTKEKSAKLLEMRKTAHQRGRATPSAAERGGDIPPMRREPALDEDDNPRESDSSNQSRPTGLPASLDLPGAKKTRATLKFATWNIKGGASPSTQPKWTRIKRELRNEQLAFIAIQETHLNDEKVGIIQAKLGNKLEFIHSSNNSGAASAGVAMIVNKEVLPMEGMDVTEMIPGRALLASLPWRAGTPLRVLVVYAPNPRRENGEFWQQLERQWVGNDENLAPVDIMLGDFNIVHLIAFQVTRTRAKP